MVNLSQTLVTVLHYRLFKISQSGLGYEWRDLWWMEEMRWVGMSAMQRFRAISSTAHTSEANSSWLVLLRDEWLSTISNTELMCNLERSVKWSWTRKWVRRQCCRCDQRTARCETVGQSLMSTAGTDTAMKFTSLRYLWIFNNNIINGWNYEKMAENGQTSGDDVGLRSVWGHCGSGVDLAVELQQLHEWVERVQQPRAVRSHYHSHVRTDLHSQIGQQIWNTLIHKKM